MGGDPLLEFWERSLRRRRIAGAVMVACALWLVACFFFPGVADSLGLEREPWTTIWGISGLLSLLGLAIASGTRGGLRAPPTRRAGAADGAAAPSSSARFGPGRPRRRLSPDRASGTASPQWSPS